MILPWPLKVSVLEHITYKTADRNQHSGIELLLTSFIRAALSSHPKFMHPQQTLLSLLHHLDRMTTIPPLHIRTPTPLIRRRFHRISDMKHQVRIHKVIVVVCFRVHHGDFRYRFVAELSLVLDEEVCEGCAVW
jgi:hypothetical protein